MNNSRHELVMIGVEYRTQAICTCGEWRVETFSRAEGAKKYAEHVLNDWQETETILSTLGRMGR